MGTTFTMDEIKKALHIQKPNTEKAFDIIDTQQVTDEDALRIKKILAGYCSARNNSLCLLFRPYGNYESNWSDVLKYISWFVIDHESILVNNKFELLPDVLIVRFCPCELGLRCDIEVLSQSNMEFLVDVLCEVLKKFCAGYENFTRDVALWIYSDEPQSRKMKSALSTIFADRHFKCITVYYVYQELKI